MKSEEEKYWNTRSQTYSELDAIGKRPAYSIVPIVKNFGLSHPFILDVGCGPGIVTKIVRENIRHSNVIGIDLSPKMIEIARRNILPGLWFIQADFLGDFAVKYMSGHTDLVLMSLFIHHLVDGTDRKALLMANEILKKDGHILIAEAVPPEDDVLEEYEYMFSIKENRNCYTKDKLISLLRGAGFVGMGFTSYRFDLRLSNWLNDRTLSKSEKKILWHLHVYGSERWKEAYNMRPLPGGDYLLSCKMCLVWGQKKDAL